MKSEAGYDHPNATFVLSPRGAWAATLTGSSFSAGDLEAAWIRALAHDDPALLARLGSWISTPRAWILLSFAGLVPALLAILLFARRGAA